MKLFLIESECMPPFTLTHGCENLIPVIDH